MLTQTLIFFLTIYTAVMVGVFLLQRHLLYHPDRTVDIPTSYGVETVEVIPLTTRDGMEIEAWHIPATDKALPLMLYFHGNAGHIGNRIQKLGYYAEKGFGVVAVSYRGYGNSKGKPTESGLFEDARALVDYAVDGLGIAPARILLYGESLGTGVATYTAKRLADEGTPAAALILEAPYTSVADRSQELYPFLPARYLLRDRFDSASRIRDIQCPLLIIHGEADAVIPVHHGRAMFNLALEPKEAVFLPLIGHTDFNMPQMAEIVSDFTRKHVSN